LTSVVREGIIIMKEDAGTPRVCGLASYKGDDGVQLPMFLLFVG
jgi:hypothetical protein